MSTVVSLWRHVYRKLRQSRCPHRISIHDLRRIRPDLVQAKCRRCGKLLEAEYGLAINTGEWTQEPALEAIDAARASLKPEGE
jgi:hypothetical protein